VAAAPSIEISSPKCDGDLRRCLHCDGALPEDRVAAADAFCCDGCRLVHALLRDEGLERYYALRGKKGEPAAAAAERRDRKWLEPIEAKLAAADAGSLVRIDLDVQGLSCAACVWLLERLFVRESAGAARIIVNPALGKLALTVRPSFPLRRFVERVEGCGYLLGPSLKSTERPSNGLLVRMGIAIAIAMNGMLLAISIYAGLDRGPLASLFHFLEFALAVASVAVGGSWFLASAIRGLRRGLLHLDLPIALGIVLAFASSTWAYLAHRSTAYFDTLTVFIALMLVGRWLQQRVIEQNRDRLLASDGVEGLLTRRLEARGPALVRCVDVRAGDRLLLAPGDVVPVEATVSGGETIPFSLDWIDGESAPRPFAPGSVVPAGAFLAGRATVSVESKQDFRDSALVDLLRAPPQGDRDVTRAASWWRSFAQIYVAVVLVLAAGALIVGLRLAGDPRLALERVTAVLIVTCPCAFGIAAPLAYEIAQARLRREGLFVRSPSFLDRAASVRRVVFDKTGTLTTGRLRIEDDGALEMLGDDARTALVNLVTRSTHPKSAAIARALEPRWIEEGFREDLVAHEVAGRGIELVLEDRHGRKRLHRLGAPGWVAGIGGADDVAFGGADDVAFGGADDVAFGVDGRILVSLSTVEELRPDAAREIDALRALGHEIFILSGDATARVHRLADAVGIPRDHAFGDQRAQDKADWVAARDRDDTLVVGDGINDGPVVDVAFTSGTPAVDRPFLAARSDFYLVSAGLGPIRLALESAHRLRRVLHTTLGVAIAYNVVTVGLAYAGKMTPLLCAILMPISSLSTVLAVIVALSKDRTTAAAPKEAVASAAA
jgi:Cu2+-exporting ATPase